MWALGRQNLEGISADWEGRFVKGDELQNPVLHTTLHLFDHLSSNFFCAPFSHLRPIISPIRPKICPLRPLISPFKPEINPSPQKSFLKPQYWSSTKYCLL